MKLPVQYLGARTVVAAAALLTVAQMAWALEPFKVQDIRVEGLQRVEAGTVLLPSPCVWATNTMTKKAPQPIRALFALGLFKDVRLEANGDVLVVVVEERPTIANVEFVGTKSLTKKPYSNRCAMWVWPSRPFDKALADRAEQELKRQYISRSLYGAEVGGYRHAH